MDRIAKINSYYEKNFAELKALHEVLNNAVRANVNADNYKILGWESRQAQYARFAAFVKNVSLDALSVLDVGCGLGDLFHFMTSGAGLSVEYTGIDISQKMIETAEEQLKVLRENGLVLPDGNKSSARFVTGDIFDQSSSEFAADWVYASGIFNLNLGNNDEFLARAFERFFELCKKGFVCSMLNVRSTDKEDTYYYYRPDDVAELAKKIGARNVRIIDDYLENDFTIIAEM